RPPRATVPPPTADRDEPPGAATIAAAATETLGVNPVGPDARCLDVGAKIVGDGDGVAGAAGIAPATDRHQPPRMAAGAAAAADTGGRNAMRESAQRRDGPVI